MSDVTHRDDGWDQAGIGGPVGPPPWSGMPRGGGMDGGVDGAFVDLYQAEHDHLLGWLRALEHDDLAAEDVCEEAFTRLYRELRAGRGPMQPAAWLHRVARNLVISDARHARIAASAAPSLVGSCTEQDPTATAAMWAESCHRVIEALRRLPDDSRTILLLAGQGCDTRTLAHNLHTTEGAARTRLHRARRALRLVSGEPPD